MKTLNTYVAFYKNREINVEAETSYAAQLKAAELLHAKKSYEVTVMIAEKNGEAVMHSGAELPGA